VTVSNKGGRQKSQRGSGGLDRLDNAVRTRKKSIDPLSLLAEFKIKTPCPIIIKQHTQEIHGRKLNGYTGWKGNLKQKAKGLLGKRGKLDLAECGGGGIAKNPSPLLVRKKKAILRA